MAAPQPDGSDALKTDGSWPAESPYGLILGHIASVWSCRRPRSQADSFLHRLFGFMPTLRIHVLEYRDVQPDQDAFLESDLVRSWLFDRTGLRSAPPPGKILYTDTITTPTPVIRFAVVPAKTAVILEEHYGPRATECVVYDYAKGELEFVGIAWKS